MNQIITLTVNPVVDKNTTLPSLLPNQKLRCSAPVYYPGGGGINVSRAIKNLGGRSIALHLSGGTTGKHFRELLRNEGIEQVCIDLSGTTRENLTVFDTTIDLKYRFGLPGPYVHENEWKKSLTKIEKYLNKNDFLVASGKLTAGIPDDYYLMVDEIVKQKKAKLILDTKGKALDNAVKADIFLFKPNLAELSSLYGIKILSNATLEKYARKFMATHKCQILAVSLGRRGALLVTSDVLEYIPAPIVHEQNTIGAGDSMLAGMLLKAQAGSSPQSMIRYGVASGAAATLRKSAQLCQLEDVESIFNWMRQRTPFRKSL